MSVKQEQEDITLAKHSPNKFTEKLHGEDEERQKALAETIKKYSQVRRAFAWPLHRVPLEKRPASIYVGKRKTKIILPRSYRSTNGEDIKNVHVGEDLNMLVYQWYDERVEVNEQQQGKIGVNFVTKDGVVSRRHEYLGPDPRVAGYEVGGDGSIRVRWWDGFLEDQWVGKDKWNVEVTFTDEGKWVEELS